MEYFDGKALINQDMKVILANDALVNTNYIALLYTANWCYKVQDVIPKLIEIYEESKKREFGLEIINVPADRSMEDMMNSFETQGNWYSVIYEDVFAQELFYMFNLTYVPEIIVLDATNASIITKTGFKEVMEIGLNVLVTWM